MSITLDGSNLGTVGNINSLTAQNSTSGTSIDFTGIPAGVKRVTVILNGVKISGGSDIQMQVGSGSVVSSGYLCGSTRVAGATPASTNYTAGFGIPIGGATNVNVHHGSFILNYIGSNTWVVSGVFGLSNTGTTAYLGGTITLSGALDRVRITASNGTDTFTAGSINILYE